MPLAAVSDTNGAARPSEARAAAPLPQLKLIKPVPIVLDRPRTLVMDFEAMARFEDETGVSAWGRDAWTGTRHLPALIWAACLHEDPDLTLATVRSWREILHIANIGYLSERLGDLWGATMPDADEGTPVAEATDDPNPPAASPAG